MENKKLILEQRINQLVIEQLIEKYNNGQLDEASFASAIGGLKNLAGKVANKFVDKAQQAKQGIVDTGREIRDVANYAGNEIKDAAKGVAKGAVGAAQNIRQTAANAGGQIKTAYKQGSLPIQRQETEQAFEKFVKSLNIYNQEARKYGSEPLSIQGMLNKYRRVYPNLFRENVEKPIISPISEGKEINYKGKNIRVTDNGYYEFYSDENGRFLKFDDLKNCKNAIDKEGNLNESKESKPKNSKLKEKLGLGDDEKLTIYRVNSELKKLKDKYKDDEKMDKDDLTFQKELNLAKTLLSSKK
jgi:hypothetical protein